MLEHFLPSKIGSYIALPESPGYSRSFHILICGCKLVVTLEEFVSLEFLVSSATWWPFF